MKNVKVLLLEGGFNEEHEVSILSGAQVKKSLNNLDIKFKSLTVNPKNFVDQIKNFNNNYLCFNALHGTFGEDGQIQKILDNNLFKYTHSKSLASKIGFDKELSKKKILNESFLTPDYFSLHIDDINEKKLLEIFEKLGSFIIKPNASGSSFGMQLITNIESIAIFIKNIENNIKIYKDHKKLLFEKYIAGRELTVSVIEKNKDSIPIDVTEIVHQNDFFDYDSKYVKGNAKHILPAKIPQNIYDNCKNLAKIAHDNIGCRAISRSDFILDNNKIYYLEINTHPGLTELSLLPEQLKYHNYSFDELILNIIKCSL